MINFTWQLISFPAFIHLMEDYHLDSSVLGIFYSQCHNIILNLIQMNTLVKTWVHAFAHILPVLQPIRLVHNMT